MSTNRQAVLDFFERLWNQGELEVAEQVLATDFTFLNPPTVMHGVEAFQKFVQSLRTSLEGLNFHLEDVVEEGDIVAARWVLTGTHAAPFMGYPATGKKVAMNGCDFCHMQDGKIIKMHASMDMLGMINQIKA